MLYHILTLWYSGREMYVCMQTCVSMHIYMQIVYVCIYMQMCVFMQMCLCMQMCVYGPCNIHKKAPKMQGILKHQFSVSACYQMDSLIMTEVDIYLRFVLEYINRAEAKV